MSPSHSEKLLFRFVSGLLALLCLILAIGLSFHMVWAKNLYPWEDGRLSHIWTGSMFAAYAIPLIWLTIKGDRHLAWSGFLALALTCLGLGIHFYLLSKNSMGSDLFNYALGSFMAALFFTVLTFWSWSSPVMPDMKLTPRWLRFAIFAPVVFVVEIAAILLLMKHAKIFPWPLKPETSVMFGIIFAVSGFYHAFAVFRKEWIHAKGQLLGFLGYNLVLILPYYSHFKNVKAEHYISLTGFFVIILTTSLVALYALFNEKRW